ncbi:hypothetical protein ACHAPC_005087 [Botrytis cinerea]
MSDWETASRVSSLSSDSAENNELLRLLRGINEKLSRDLDSQSVLNASKPSEPNATRPEFWRWYENTYSGPQKALSVELPPSRPASPDKGKTPQHKITESLENDVTSYECLDKFSKGLKSWGHSPSAIPPLNSDVSESRTKILTDCLGVSLHIPSDGRIGLPFTMQGIDKCIKERGCDPRQPESARMNIPNHLQLAMKVCQYFLKCSEIQFLIEDYNPWSKEIKTYNVSQLLSTFNQATNSIYAESSHLGSSHSESSHSESSHSESSHSESSHSESSHLNDIDNTMLDTHTEHVLSTSEKIVTFDPLILPQVKFAGELAPWRRLIFLNGLAFSSQRNIGNETEAAHMLADGLLTNGYAGELIKQHLACRFPAFIYSPYRCSSHYTLTFLELVEITPSGTKSRWKTGSFFGNRPEYLFRRLMFSTLTVSTFTSSHCDNSTTKFDSGPFAPFYTILILGPDRHSINSKSRFMLTPDTAIHAELECIGLALSNVIERWRTLNFPFRELLDENFLDIEQYSNLLFDDEKFTRSRKYFWAIGCLTEVDNVLSDNIKQWDIYYQERLQPLLDDTDIIHRLDAACLYPPAVWETSRGHDMLKQLKKSIQQVQTHVNTLKELRNEFSRKLETTKALRDGLFNASALVESRASTRLGENVKLLTYVSIFYLPLAFCAALWAIPNIQESSTKGPFITTTFIVGAITYAIVLNMDFISQKIDANYSPQRQRLVDHMQKDNSEWWRETGERFEVFKPTNESKVPTEWWIPIYLVRKIFQRGFCTELTSKKDDDKSFACSDSNSFSQCGSIKRNHKSSKLKSVFARLRWGRKLEDAPV